VTKPWKVGDPPVFNTFRSYHRSYVLGADDGAGIWLLLELIDAKVPGTYVFHHSEECGGLGSRAMANSEKDWLRQFKRAVAFDRKGTSDIITTQRGGTCCSEGFASALGDALNLHNHTYSTAAGSFTDTANYIDYIPECTNISCGYYNEHTNDEWLDLKHIKALRDAIVLVDWETLPATRDPTPVAYTYGNDGFAWDYPQGGGKWSKGKGTKGKGKKTPLDSLELAAKLTDSELEDECWAYPFAAAELIRSCIKAKQDEELDKLAALAFPS